MEGQPLCFAENMGRLTSERRPVFAVFSGEFDRACVIVGVFPADGEVFSLYFDYGVFVCVAVLVRAFCAEEVAGICDFGQIGCAGSRVVAPHKTEMAKRQVGCAVLAQDGLASRGVLHPLDGAAGFTGNATPPAPSPLTMSVWT